MKSRRNPIVDMFCRGGMEWYGGRIVNCLPCFWGEKRKEKKRKEKKRKDC